ncbi:MAG: Dps family protein [Saprospiraceae bacterium]|jgi:starvation-inducible DNA-binding protein
MKTTSLIGLDKEKSTQLAQKLNELLANYSIFYQNVRGFHWNIKGDKFFELHLKFEELYNDLLLKMDEIAERILTLGQAPDHRYSTYLKDSMVKESGIITDGNQAVDQILVALESIIILQRSLLNQSAEADDEGTNALMSDYIREQEKLVWMYAAFRNQ